MAISDLVYAPGMDGPSPPMETGVTAEGNAFFYSKAFTPPPMTDINGPQSPGDTPEADDGIPKENNRPQNVSAPADQKGSDDSLRESYATVTARSPPTDCVNQDDGKTPTYTTVSKANARTHSAATHKRKLDALSPTSPKDRPQKRQNNSVSTPNRNKDANSSEKPSGATTRQHSADTTAVAKAKEKPAPKTEKPRNYKNENTPPTFLDTGKENSFILKLEEQGGSVNPTKYPLKSEQAIRDFLGRRGVKEIRMNRKKGWVTILTDQSDPKIAKTIKTIEENGQEIMEGEGYRWTITSGQNKCTGIIKNMDPYNISLSKQQNDREIEKILMTHNPTITKATRLGRTRAFKVTFKTPALPKNIKIGKTQTRAVELLIKKMPLCTRCALIGHVTSACKSETKFCPKCASKGHGMSECESQTMRCRNCAGPHSALSPNCPRTKLVAPPSAEATTAAAAAATPNIATQDPLHTETTSTSNSSNRNNNSNSITSNSTKKDNNSRNNTQNNKNDTSITKQNKSPNTPTERELALENKVAHLTKEVESSKKLILEIRNELKNSRQTGTYNQEQQETGDCKNLLKQVIELLSLFLRQTVTPLPITTPHHPHTDLHPIN